MDSFKINLKVECKDCKRILSQKSMSKHRRFHCELGPKLKKQCAKCNKILSGYSSMASHLKFNCSANSKLPKAECKFCNKKITANNLTGHIRKNCKKVNNNTSKECKYCKLKFYDDRNYINHIRRCIKRSYEEIKILCSLNH